MKNIFTRISDIVSANINALIDQAEDPEKMIRHIIREMEENICFVKRDAAISLASEKRLENELNFHIIEVGKWLSRAETGIEADEEEMAREALFRKKEHENTSQELSRSLDTARQTNRRLRLQLKEMCRKLEEARRKAVSLKIRQHAAEARGRINSSMDNLNDRHNVQSDFARMESKVMDMELKTEAMAELNNEEACLTDLFEKVELDREVEEELYILKKKCTTKETA